MANVSSKRSLCQSTYSHLTHVFKSRADYNISSNGLGIQKCFIFSFSKDILGLDQLSHRNERGTWWCVAVHGENLITELHRGCRVGLFPHLKSSCCSCHLGNLKSRGVSDTTVSAVDFFPRRHLHVMAGQVIHNSNQAASFSFALVLCIVAYLHLYLSCHDE